MMRLKITWLLLGAILVSATALLIYLSLAENNGKKDTSANARSEGPATAQIQTVLVTTVVSRHLDRQIILPGELTAYQDVAIYPKVQGFVQRIWADRGSVVKRGQLLAKLIAPELTAQRSEAEAKARAVEAQRSEAEAKLQSIRAQKLEAEAKLAADEATYRRLKAASATPGVVAGNDLEVAQKTVEADRARVRSLEENEKAAQAHLQSLEASAKAAREASRSLQELESYLSIRAPFAGIITERNAHEGSLVGPSGGPASLPMLRIQQVNPLRLIVSVPELYAGGIAAGVKVDFTVPAFPGQTFSGVVKRIARSLDVKTRTMPVELDVANPSAKLAPGMYAEVVWPARRQHSSLFVPSSAVATTTERTFVIRIRDGVAEWVDVRRGAQMGDLVEVFGNLREGDRIAVRGTDELRAGTRVIAKQISARN